MRRHRFPATKTPALQTSCSRRETRRRLNSSTLSNGEGVSAMENIPDAIRVRGSSGKRRDREKLALRKPE